MAILKKNGANNMTAIRSFLKREPVLIISALAAVISCFLVPPDAEYIDYIDFRTLSLLYALMTVVAGLRKAGVFAALAHTLCLCAKNIRSIGIILVCLCFFSSMLITNDVALLTFVPFSVVVLGLAGRRQELIRVVVLQTVAANLGSMLTPVGNPQNLYLYSRFELSMGDFLLTTLPVWLLSLVLVLGCCFSLSGAGFSAALDDKPAIERRSLGIYLALFAVCLLTVVRVLPWPAMLAAVIVIVLILDRPTLLEADFMLLLTFVAFFIFAGNLARIEAVDSLLRRLLSGREYWTALLTSQVISNVPAALLLSGFTDNAKALLLGTNIGGLGTPIASLASLISLKLYSRSDDARLGKFLLEFTVVNVILLVILSIFQMAVL